MFAAPLPRPVTRSIMTSSPDITFHDGRSIPQLGYGVWQVENDVAADVVTQAVEAGFRRIDTARGYDNEAGVGRALKQLHNTRDDQLPTTQAPNPDPGYDNPMRSFDGTTADLGLDEPDRDV